MTYNGTDNLNNIVNHNQNDKQIYDLSKTNTQKNTLNSFDNLLIFSNEYIKINELSNVLNELFLSNESLIIKSNYQNNTESNNNISYAIFNHIYDKEFERGNIEYKRSLESYYQNDKTNKLIRQIYWRMYEGIVNTDKECCYYIIGIEDSGHPSFLSQKELFNSLYYMLKCIKNTEIIYSYLFVKNTILEYDYIIVKFWPSESNFFDFF